MLAEQHFFPLFIDPFLHYGFMQTALLATILLCLSTIPIGAFVVLRRLSLIGDTLSHAVLPGVAIAYVLFGMSIVALIAGAVFTGLLVAIFAGFVTRTTRLKEDSSFASFYLISLSLGVCLISAFGSSNDLLHFLFGDLLAVPNNYLYWLFGLLVCSGIIMISHFRYFVAESFDPSFMRINKLKGNWYYFLFLALFVINIVFSYFILGTLLSMGLFILPVIAARLWVRDIIHLIALATIFGIVFSYMGLVVSYHFNLPAGASIVLCLGLNYAISLLFHWVNSSRFKLSIPS
ncbi:MAG: metal ABC transporter permease [Alphaproteobacteria bacterium]|nr:MAG: metal ABC transporter permease [Alphaproteobacteria bacterium]